METSYVAEVLAGSEGGVTKEQLDGCIAKLNSRIEEVKAQVYETINTHYETFTSTLSFAANLDEEVSGLSTELDAIVETVHDPKAQLTDAASEYEALSASISESELMIAVLRILNSLHEGITRFDSLLAAGDYSPAADLMQDLTNQLNTLHSGGEAGCDARIFTTVSTELASKKAKLKCRLEELFERALLFNTETQENKPVAAGKRGAVVVASLSVAKAVKEVSATAHYDNPASLSAILHAMEVLGILNARLASLARRLNAELIQPLFGMPFAELEVESDKFASVLMVVSTPVNEQGRGSETGRPSPTALLMNVLEVLEFVADTIPTEGVVGVLGTHLWDSFSANVVSESLSQAIPATQDELAAYKRVTTAVEGFEAQARSLGFMPDDSVPVLSDYAHNIDAHYARNRRTSILATARELITGGDRNTARVSDATERCALANGKGKKGGGSGGVVSEENYFTLEPCAVSSTAQTLVEMAYQTMGEAVEASSAAAIDLYAATRDLFTLYRAVFPVHHADRLENDPHAALLFHNDCLYFAHHLLTIGYSHQRKMPSVDVTVTFVDMVPVFRNLALNQLDRCMSAQASTLKSVWEKVGGLTGAATDKKNAQIEEGINEIRGTFTQLAESWRPILATRVYFAAMGLLLDVVAECVTDSVLALTDATEDDVHALSTALDSLAECTACLNSPNPETKKDESVAVDSVASGWSRFEAVKTVIVGEPSDVVDSVVRGDLVGVSRDEVKALLGMLFEDNAELREILGRL